MHFSNVKRVLALLIAVAAMGITALSQAKPVDATPTTRLEVM